MPLSEIDGPAREFLARMFELTGGEPARQVSMYEVGAALGWERDTASSAAQDLMGLGLVEIRTLSGGIGLSAQGVETMQAALAPSDRGPALLSLGAGPLMSSDECQAVTRVCDGIKARAGSLGLDFETLTELTADLRSITCQLDSPRPKTGIVRECLRSLQSVLKRTRDTPCLDEIRTLTGDRSG
jgi:hypothetical protein